MQLTEQEREYFSKLLYKDFIFNRYLIEVEKIAELPQELVGLMNKLEADNGEVEVVEEVGDES